MASAIDTATAEAADAAQTPPPSPAAAPSRRRHRLPRGLRLWPHAVGRWRISPLTRRILTVNVLALALLAAGFLYLGKYQASLVDQQVEALTTQGEVFAAALSEGAVLDSAEDGEVLLPDLARQMMRRLVQPTHMRTRLFDKLGRLVVDSRALRDGGAAVQVRELPPLQPSSSVLAFADRVYAWILDRLPQHARRPTYREIVAPRAQDYAEVLQALKGRPSSAVRSDPQTGGLVISVAVPVQRYRQVLGAVMLSTGSGEIQTELRNVRFELLQIFAAALLITILLSFWLAGTIARPIRRLAAAAERARGRGARVEIPDFTGRHDEIGDLSRSLREMTDALWQRMSAIESFAADVAHEIKNPLGSLRSAVETATRIEDPQKQRRLMAIILDDVQRLDRLITDISDASRLDAELGRLEMEPVDIGEMLRALVDMHEAAAEPGASRLVLDLPEGDRPLIVPGLEIRLSQVFQNLIANALSFSPPHSEIHLTARHDGRAVLVAVEDSGPGVPEEKLTAIFDRFYTQRPEGEKFGTHSGLGLSISKQIAEAHRGRIWAENRHDAAGAVLGARFLVRLPEAP
jgi:two-component system, OmpR family, sensor histidine kinase ChvG